MDKPSFHSIKGGRITAEQLLAYREGTLPKEERLHLEQLMEDDPFLRDAVEGLSFATSDQIKSALESINKQIDAKVHSGKIVSTGSNLRKYAAAATILVFLAATLLIMQQLNRSTQTAEVALNDTDQTYPSFNNADTTGMGGGDTNSEKEEMVSPIITKTTSQGEATMEAPISIDEDISGVMNDIDIETVKVGSVSTTDDVFASAPVYYDIATLDKKNVVLEAEPFKSEEIVLAGSQQQVVSESVTLQKTDKKRNKNKTEDAEEYAIDSEVSKNYDVAKPSVAADEKDSFDAHGDSVFTNPETYPEFIGGNEALRAFLNANLTMPTGTPEGTIWVKFKVYADGKIGEAYVAKSLSPISDTEVLRVINLMPVWKPGTQVGKNVDVWMTLPIKVGPAQQ
jgi:hypothetical protein